MSEIVSKDSDTQLIQRNVANSVNALLTLFNANPITLSQGLSLGGPLSATAATIAGALAAGSITTAAFTATIFNATSISAGTLAVSGTTTLSGPLVNNGTSTFKAYVGPFSLNAVAISAGATTQSFLGPFNSAIFPFAPTASGSIVGISGYASLATGSTTLTLIAAKNGAATAVQSSAAVSTSSTIMGNAFAKGTVTFAPGDNLRLDVKSSAAVTASGVFNLLVEFAP